MSAWPEVRLADICEITIGRTPSRDQPQYWDGELPWASIADLNQGKRIKATKERITSLGAVHSGSRLIPEGTVLLSFKLSVGKVSISGIPLYTNEAIAALPLLSHEQADPAFLAWALRSKDLTKGLDRAAKGLTLNKAKLEDVRIPLPPLPEQRRIAAILDEADVLRAKRRAALAQLDEMAQAIFVEMFGDPISNSKKWPIAKLGSIAEIERGKFTPRPRNDPSYYNGQYPFIQTGDINSSGGRLRMWSQSLNEKGRRVSRSFPPGTVVIAIVGATLGVTAILEIEAYCPDSVIGLQVRASKGTAEYVEHLLRIWRPIFISQAPETARANMNLETLRPLEVPAPPVQLQRSFSEHVIAIEGVKATSLRQLTELDAIFASLQQSAFAGEL